MTRRAVFRNTSPGVNKTRERSPVGGEKFPRSIYRLSSVVYETWIRAFLIRAAPPLPLPLPSAALANSFRLVFLCHPFYLHSVQPFQISSETGSNYRAIYKLRGRGKLELAWSGRDMLQRREIYITRISLFFLPRELRSTECVQSNARCVLSENFYN